jgi:hypothetical protein
MTKKTRSQLDREIVEVLTGTGAKTISGVVDPKAGDRREKSRPVSRMSKRDHAVVCSEREVGDELVVIRDSEDLGMSKGTRMRVVWADSRMMDVDVPSLDMRYSGLSVHHPDIARAPKDWAASEDIRKIARWKTARSSKPWSRGKRP